MARIFRFEEIPDHVPEIESFSFIGSLIRERLANNPDVIGAVIYGALAHKTVTVRSFVDLLVLYKPNDHNEQPLVLSSVTRQAAMKNVALDIQAVDVNSAKIGAHGIDISLRDHLKYCSTTGWAIKCDPVPYFKTVWAWTSEPQEFCTYLFRVIRELESGLATLDIKSHNEPLLKAALETPVHVVRRLMPLKGYCLSRDTKTDVIQEYRRRSTDEEFDLFIQCCKAETLYHNEVLRQLENPDSVKYQEIIEFVYRTALQTLRFCKLLAHNLLSSGFEESSNA